jgi:ketosteroid isomerase-like protein
MAGQDTSGIKADPQTDAAMLRMLESFCSAFEARDAEAVMRLFAPDPDVVVVTSEQSLLRGPDELRAFLRAYVRGTSTYSWNWDRVEVSSAGAVAWLLAEGPRSPPPRPGSKSTPTG